MLHHFRLFLYVFFFLPCTLVTYVLYEVWKKMVKLKIFYFFEAKEFFEKILNVYLLTLFEQVKSKSQTVGSSDTGS